MASHRLLLGYWTSGQIRAEKDLFADARLPDWERGVNQSEIWIRLDTPTIPFSASRL